MLPCRVVLALPLLLAPFPASSQTSYQKPPQEVLNALTASPPPTLSVSPARDYAIVLQPVRYPPIAEVAQPMARLAGLRIDIQTNGMHLAPYYTGYLLKRFSDASDVPLHLPDNAKFSAPVWSPNGKQFAFTNTTASGIDLWIAPVAGGAAHKIANAKINGIQAERSAAPVRWLEGNRMLLVRLIPPDRGPAPALSTIPEGPNTQESSGHAGPVRTYEDMLSSSHDEDLLDYYATAQLALVDSSTGSITPIGKPAIYNAAEPSPDGNHLLVEHIHRPYSYLHPVTDFPVDIEIWDRSGAKEYQLATLGLADRVPIGGVRTGPREYEWLPASSAPTLIWAEAMDGGNPKEKAPHRDRLLAVSAPFHGEPHEVFETEQRFTGLQPIERSAWALVEDYDRDKRWLRTIEIDTAKSGAPGRLVFSRNVQDRYKDPGTPIVLTDAQGREAILRDGNTILLSGLGASPQGDRPFLDRYNLETQKAERIFQSTSGSYEVVEAVLDNTGARLVTRRESPTDGPNYFLRAGSHLTPLTTYSDPNPRIREIKKQLITYKREDGVPLSFMLYLPPNYQPGTRLPTLLWAYPLEYNDAATAGQVSGSTDRFPVLTGHLLALLHGYAVLDNAAMPVIGDPETVNNTYVKQIVMDAKAAIDKAVEMGVTDRNRVGVGGHSYGAFMTANLLAHCDLFHAGIAESGAYNRTLTPFGFQTERRTLWEAPDVYIGMSPFMSAQKIKTPLLMIHGEADDNTGTFPIQSERMYEAIRGNGGTVRLVFLPAEAHGYRALETHEHVLYEELRWLDKYLTPEQSN